MNLSAKIFWGLIIISLVFFVYFRDRYEEPVITTDTVNNTITIACDDGYVSTPDVTNQSHIWCYKEASFGHIKYTFFSALAMALWTGVITIFYIEYKKKDESSVVQFYQDKYQSENKPIQKCPDIFREKGYIWTYKGYDRVISSTESVLFVATKDMAHQVAKSIIFEGAREELSPTELYYYLNKDAKLFKRMTGASAAGFISTNLIRVEGTVPKIYFPRPLPYNVLRGFYSIKGNYKFGANRFTTVIKILFQMKKSIDFLDRQMDLTFKSMMLKGESYVAGTSRIGQEADKTRRTNSAESSRINPNDNINREPRREM